MQKKKLKHGSMNKIMGPPNCYIIRLHDNFMSVEVVRALYYEIFGFGIWNRVRIEEKKQQRTLCLKEIMQWKHNSLVHLHIQRILCIGGLNKLFYVLEARKIKVRKKKYNFHSNGKVYIACM